MIRLEVSGAVRHIYGSLGVKVLRRYKICLQIAHGGLPVSQQPQYMTMLSALRTDLIHKMNSFHAT